MSLMLVMSCSIVVLGSVLAKRRRPPVTMRWRAVLTAVIYALPFWLGAYLFWR